MLVIRVYLCLMMHVRSMIHMRRGDQAGVSVDSSSVLILLQSDKMLSKLMHAFTRVNAKGATLMRVEVFRWRTAEVL